MRHFHTIEDAIDELCDRFGPENLESVVVRIAGKQFTIEVKENHVELKDS